MFDDEMKNAFVEETRDYDDEAEVQDLAEFLRGDYDCDEDPISDYYEDWEVLAETRTLHNSRLDKLAAMMREELGDVAVFSTGGCDLCETCTYPDAPCARPDARRHSLSAHGVAVGTTCQNAGMDYSFINGSVRYIGMILYD